jgi:hypothetical protein
MGSISPTTGMTTGYTPPATLVTAQMATLTASAAGKTASAMITINPEPRLSITPVMNLATAGGSATSFVATLPNSTAGISWTRTGKGTLSFSSGTTNNYTPPGALTASETETITVTSGGASVSAMVTVNPAPPTPTLAVGMQPRGVAIGDLDGDGRADIANTNSTDGTVSVSLANAAGGFATSVAYRVGTQPQGIAIADLNGDGKLDIVAANSMSQTARSPDRSATPRTRP